MSTQMPCLRSWQVTGCSVQGKKHQRRQISNQDAHAWCTIDSAGTAAVAVLAVADGHGSDENFRSADGARLAAEIAVLAMADLVESVDLRNEVVLCHRAQNVLPGELVDRWRQAVLCHAKENPLPLQFGDHSKLPRKIGPTDMFLAYGTTLLLVATTPMVVLLLQIGDGDILTVTDKGQVQRPLPCDARLIVNETTSLCSPHALRDFRFAALPLAEDVPALILASTDGYANSFQNDKGFRQVGSDLLTLIRTEGFEAVEGSLEDWLTEASEQGSGDDVTLGLLCRSDVSGDVP